MGAAVPDYVCQREAIQQARPVCQHIVGDVKKISFESRAKPLVPALIVVE
jgi:hypothetical protein